MPFQLDSTKPFKFWGALELASCVQQAYMWKWVFFPPKYALFTCSPLWSLRKCCVLPEPNITAESWGGHISPPGAAICDLGLNTLSPGWLCTAGAGARLYPWRKDLQPHHPETFLTFHTEKALKGWGRTCGQSPLKGISSSSSPSLNDADKVAHWLTTLQPNVLWI